MALYSGEKECVIHLLLSGDDYAKFFVQALGAWLVVDPDSNHIRYTAISCFLFNFLSLFWSFLGNNSIFLCLVILFLFLLDLNWEKIFLILFLNDFINLCFFLFYLGLYLENT